MTALPFSQQVQRALYAARTPGWMFPAHLMDVYFEQEVSENGAIAWMHIGAHCLDASGLVSKAAVALLADVCMAAAVRGYVGKSVRIATVTMRLSFNQRPRQGRLRAVAKVQFLPRDLRVNVAVVSLRIEDQAGVLCATGEATFAVLDNKQGMPQHPLPTHSTLAAALDPSEFTEQEQTIWERANACERSGAGALEHFWSLVFSLEHSDAGVVRKEIDIARHNGNRVGHLQGGVLLALLANASEAVPNAPFVLTDISVQYLEPVIGPHAVVEAKPLRVGRNAAFIHTTISDRQGNLLAAAQASLVKKALDNCDVNQ